jgi:hypothetical protein
VHFSEDRSFFSLLLSLLELISSLLSEEDVTTDTYPELISTKSLASFIASSNLVTFSPVLNCILPDVSIIIREALSLGAIPLFMDGAIAASIKKRRAAISINISMFLISFLENVMLFSFFWAFFHSIREGITIGVPLGFIRYIIMITGIPIRKISGTKVPNVI